MRMILTAAVAAAATFGASEAQEVALYVQETGSSERGLLLLGPDGEKRFFGLNSLFGEQPGEDGTSINYDEESGLYYMLVDSSNANGGAGFALVSVDPISGERNILNRYTTDGYFPTVSSGLFLNMRGFGVSPGLSAQFNEKIEVASAVMSALDIQLPVDRNQNRLGLTSGAFGDEQAFGVSYARVQGRFDVGLAYAQGDGGRYAGKVSVGVSW